MEPCSNLFAVGKVFEQLLLFLSRPSRVQAFWKITLMWEIKLACDLKNAIYLRSECFFFVFFQINKSFYLLNPSWIYVRTKTTVCFERDSQTKNQQRTSLSSWMFLSILKMIKNSVIFWVFLFIYCFLFWSDVLFPAGKDSLHAELSIDVSRVVPSPAFTGTGGIQSTAAGLNALLGLRSVSNRSDQSVKIVIFSVQSRPVFCTKGILGLVRMAIFFILALSNNL